MNEASNPTANPAETNAAWFTKNDLAKRFAIKLRTLDRWRREGRFPPHDFLLPGDRPRWLPSTIDAWLDSIRNPAAKPKPKPKPLLVTSDPSRDLAALAAKQRADAARRDGSASSFVADLIKPKSKIKPVKG